MASDIRDVLGLPSSSLSAPPAKRQKPNGPAKGVSRELYSLLGDNLPPAVIQPQRFKEKPRFKQQAVRWVQAPFTNGARGDGLVLRHWRRGPLPDSDAPTAPYAFEVFNKHPDLVQYSDEEYATFLEKPGWSKEDTDVLMDLCRQWDLRFVVVHDRWPSSAQSRTLEQLKDRYYGICTTLLSSRGQSTDGMHYDLAREETRKKYLEELFQRTPDEIDEENRLIIESRRLEAAEKQLAQQKEELLRTLETPQSTGSVAQNLTSQGLATLAQSMLTADKQKSKKKASEPAAAAAKQRYRKLSPREQREHGVVWHEKLSSGAFLRSQKTVALKQTVATKVLAVMQELGMSNVLTMPTEKTVRRFDLLQSKIATLLEAKRVVDKADQMDAPTTPAAV
jgi:DNA methyltransferase 1-associated protein 1